MVMILNIEMMYLETIVVGGAMAMEGVVIFYGSDIMVEMKLVVTVNVGKKLAVIV
jgi:hypothetical protein